LARSYLNCLTRKIVIVDDSRGSTSSSTDESVGFWIDDAVKSLAQTARYCADAPRR
jgi:hypothetical protein